MKWYLLGCGWCVFVSLFGLCQAKVNRFPLPSWASVRVNVPRFHFTLATGTTKCTQVCINAFGGLVATNVLNF